MIRYIEFGNIFAIEGINCYAHGCNCAGAMGKGIALQFKLKYPLMFKKYKEICLKGEFKLGDVFEYAINDERIYNLGTQETWRTKAVLSAIEESVYKMFELASLNSVKSIAIPKIGAGLGGLNWNDVKKVLEKAASDFPNIELVVVENYKDSIP